MEEARSGSLLQRLATDTALNVSECNAGKKHRSNLSAEDMDNKENLCTASENSSDFSATSEAMPPFRRAKKGGGGCNLRKSLAWNMAFFTEEGVLDSSELSILSGSASNSSVSGSASKSSGRGSATKPSMNFLSSMNGEISPLTNYSIRSRANSNNKMHQGSAFDDKKDVNRLSTSEPSVHKESIPRMVPEKAPLPKGISRYIPRAPAVSSQKRLACATMPNQASKLPKFTATKLQTSSLALTANCSVPTRRQSNQNVKPANTEQNARSKGSLSTLKKALNCPASSSRISGHNYEEKTVNRTSELPSSADMPTLETGKHASCLRTPQSHRPPISGTVGSSKLEKVARSFSEIAQHSEGVHPPARVQAKPSCLRMPTPSLGFFCQAKVSPHSLQLQKESQKSSACDDSSQSLKKPKSQKHTNDLGTLRASHGQDQSCVSESTGIEVTATVVSIPFTSKNTDFSADCGMPSFTNPTLSPEINQKDSKRKILGSVIEPPVASILEKEQKELLSDFFMDERDLGKQSRRQGSGCEPESPSDLVPPTGNSSLLVERKFAYTLMQPSDFVNAGGMHLFSVGSERHPSAQSNVTLQNCSPKQPQEGDGGNGQSVISQQWEDGIFAGRECLPDGKCDLFSGLSFENNEKDIDGCPSLEKGTSLRSSEMQTAGSTSLTLACASTENLILSVEGQPTECALYDIAQRGLDSGTISLEEVCGTEKSESLGSSALFPIQESEIASQSDSEVFQDKRDVMEKPKEASTMLKQLKAAPFSDEWLVALESFGEDILQMQTGAVQNSPPDKPTPELGPWSPVKPKNQDIGPYDCTKYSKSLSTASSE